MEPCRDKYIDDWNNYVHIYTKCRPVWKCNNNGYNYLIANNSNVYANWTALPKRNSTGLTNNIQQRYHRYMEPGDNQYISNRNNNLHLYAKCWSMCGCNNNGYNHHITNNSNIHSSRPALPKRNSTSFTSNIQQRHNRHMEPCDNHYNQHRNNNIHVHS